MNALLRRCFPIYVPISGLLLALGPTAACEIGYWIMRLVSGIDVPPILQTRDQFALLTVAVIGGLRTYFAHPFCRVDYSCWLALTPWTSAKPLPFAPLQLTLQDVLVMLLPGLLLHDATIRWAYFPLAFLAAYLLPHCVCFFSSGLHAHAYVLLFGIGLCVRLIHQPEAALVVAAVLYGVAVHGMELWLAQFPRPFWPYACKSPPQYQAGWPFADLLDFERDSRCEVGRWTYWPVPLLFGWFFYCLTYAAFGELTWVALRDQEADMWARFALMFGFIATIAAGIRVFVYAIDAQPPIDVIGRLLTGRWVIPGYDVILLTPLAMILLPTALFVAQFQAGLPVSVTFGTTLALLGLLYQCGPPLWTAWRLTGDYRLVPSLNAMLKSGAKEI